jgi:hypothetical protein
MSLTNTLSLILNSSLTGTVGAAAVTAKINEAVTETLTGTDSVYTVTAELTGTSDSYDLAGTLTDPLGNAVTFDTVEVLYIKNNGENNMTIGGANHLPILADGSDRITLPPEAYLYLVNAAGYSVTGGTGDLIIINGTEGDEYDLIVIGTAP